MPSDPQDSGALKRPRLADARLTDARLADTRLADTRLADARLVDVRLRPPPPVMTMTPTTTATLSKIKGGRVQTSPVPNAGFHTKTEIQATAAQSQVVAAQSGSPLSHTQLSGSPSQPAEAEAAKAGPTAPVGPQRPEGSSPDGGKHQPLASNQHKKKKSKKHKDKERERSKDKGGRQWIESSPDHKQSLDKLHGTDPLSPLFIPANRTTTVLCYFGPVVKNLIWKCVQLYYLFLLG